MRCLHALRCVGPRGLLLLSVLIAGCTSSSPVRYRLARYRPEGEGRQPDAWIAQRAVAPGVEQAEVSSNEVAQVTSTPTTIPLAAQETLQHGAAVTVYLRGIPQPEDVREIIDAAGGITLPLVGEVRVAGMTSTAAQDAIARAYIDGEYYRSINVIVVAKQGDYYVRGEVARRGKYTVLGDLTLLQAIAEAGGFTDYARRSEIQVIRDGSSAIHNTDRIEEGREPDPLIQAGDIIIVPRRWM